MLDLSKPIQTRDGRKARILTSTLIAEQPIVAIITEDDGERVETFFANGRFVDGHPSGWDLVNVVSPTDVLRLELVESLAGRAEPSPELSAMRSQLEEVR